MGFLLIVFLALLAYVGYLFYAKELTFPIDQSIFYKKVMALLEKAKKFVDEQQAKQKSHPKTDEVTAPKKEAKPETKKEEKKVEAKKSEPKEGTHVPKPKGDEPVIEDRPNGKKEVVSGDKSILIDRIQQSHFGPVDKKFNEAYALKDVYVKAKEENAPNKSEAFEKYDKAIKEANEMQKDANKKIFEEVNVYMNEPDAIDMHGLKIENSIDILKEEIDKAKNAGKKILKVQCGMGHHNTVGFSKIKEAVVKYCNDSSIKFDEDKDHGFVNIQL
ncbi:hypothetical protein EIN_031180 [Entamoeba invadens IP1]|uniref:Smr domain-containing protein n=1 Tax=Entamoeba invadens IP1 TaxID=370355 RepID=A0A0A1TY22_ENTIV|nr:hypothetical protein EIN_031180 [Entamoeba invadens IP1]ELP86417.1 hypothetical protein EIN_031180 [Entamoeba invadens IP1]|eukprot:XP_004185763.1 hypothetical protein EIN_031180 [Entamoeba invadens IP1]